MFDRDAFLAVVLERAGSKAEIARILDLPPSRIGELFRKSGDRKRNLSMVEGMKLARALDIPLGGQVNVDLLKAILTECLRYPPKDGWTDQAVDQLANGIEYASGLLGGSAIATPSQDAINVAARVVLDRLRNTQ